MISILFILSCSFGKCSGHCEIFDILLKYNYNIITIQNNQCILCFILFCRTIFNTTSMLSLLVVMFLIIRWVIENLFYCYIIISLSFYFNLTRVNRVVTLLVFTFICQERYQFVHPEISGNSCTKKSFSIFDKTPNLLQLYIKMEEKAFLKPFISDKLCHF